MNFLRRTGSINLILWLAWVLSAEAFLDKSHHPIKKDRQKSRKQKATGFVLAQIQPVSWDHQAVSHHIRACSLSCYIRYLSLWHQLWVLWNSVMKATSFSEPENSFWLKNQKKRERKEKKKSRGEGTPLHGVTPWQERRDLMSQASTHGSLPVNFFAPRAFWIDTWWIE